MASPESDPKPSAPSAPSSPPARAEKPSPPTSGGRGRGRGNGRGRGAGRRTGGPRVVRPEDLEDGDEALMTPGEADQPSAATPSPPAAKTTRAADKSDKPKKDNKRKKGKEKADDDKKPEGKTENEEKEPTAEETEVPTSPSPKVEAADAPPDDPTSPSAGRGNKRPVRKIGEPYVNPDRINTGGLKNEKLSAEALEKVMERMRIANEQLKARRELVDADEDTFKATIAKETERQQADRSARNARVAAERKAHKESNAAERARAEGSRKIQEQIDATRAEAAKRKLAKQSGREWDAEKRDEWGKTAHPGGRPRGGRGGGFSGPPRTNSGAGGPSANTPKPPPTPNDLEVPES
ncbi:hypothetical protein FRB99_008117 [Tulasnella sp. 403]|nr:hypothetical protein FRB99_008117 [Tulasnella sp. 403]